MWVKALVCTIVALISTCVHAQEYMVVQKVDGTKVEYSIKDVDKVYFYVNESQLNTPAESIDLGLPSGTKWASYNVGATSPEEYGGFYAWGETEEKSDYSWSTYKYSDGDTPWSIGNDIAGTEYDVAHVLWGGNWQMPNRTQMQELRTYCTWTSCTKNDVYGFSVVGQNGNSIFIPAGGYRWGTSQNNVGTQINYWSSIISEENNKYAYGLYAFGVYFGNDYTCERFGGLSVRPVEITKDEPSFSVEAIDLGLPSGTKWANCNVGATSSEDYGYYYAWGETETKTEYTAENSLTSGKDVGGNISGTEYDVAHVKWGDDWKIPNESQINELISNCTWKWTTQNEVNGYLIFGTNGNSIFLPAAGNYNGTEPPVVGSSCEYWTSASHKINNFAYYADLQQYARDYRYSLRYYGRPIRPVK